MEDLFRNTHEALTYAFNFQSQQYPLSPMSKLSGLQRRGTGKGLVSTDGAAQAGMIRRKLEDLSPLHQACIVARYSPRHIPCLSCGGEKPLQEWKEAIVALRDWSISAFTGLSHASIREAIILSYYDKKVSLQVAADRVHVPVRNVRNHRDKIHVQLVLLDNAALAQAGDVLGLVMVREHETA